MAGSSRLGDITGPYTIDEGWRRLLRQLRSAVTPALRNRVLQGKTSTKPKRVLVVEDDIDSVRTLSMLVETMGHQVEYAINGYVAISIAKRFKPDVVLLDIGLPGMNGFDVCQALKKDSDCRHAAVIVVTAYDGQDFRKHSAEVGGELHLVKPVAPEVLEHAIENSGSLKNRPL
jgi:CheY-like chemotaxis protein